MLISKRCLFHKQEEREAGIDAEEPAGAWRPLSEDLLDELINTLCGCRRCRRLPVVSVSTSRGEGWKSALQEVAVDAGTKRSGCGGHISIDWIATGTAIPFADVCASFRSSDA